MNITPNKKDINIQSYIDDTKIKHIDKNSDEKYFKFLGFRMDNKLKWNHHFQHVKNKPKTANYLLATTKNLYTENIKKLIYRVDALNLTLSTFKTKKDTAQLILN